MNLMRSIRRVFSRRPSARPALSVLPVRGRYDAAQTTTDMGNHWAAADALDADSSNSLAVRKKLRERARYEIANNAYARGMVSTHSNYVIGTGPKLRMQTGSQGTNAMVESAWKHWCQATGFHAKLRTMYLAKTGDGEGVARLVTNPAVQDKVLLDLVPVECDRLTAPVYTAEPSNYVDGVTFDDFGNPIAYDILTRHPGSSLSLAPMVAEYERVPAAYILHWFHVDRPGQHRGVPEITSSLNLFGQARRYREAVIAAAETAADLAVVLEMGVGADGEADEARPFTTMPIEKRVMVATPAGAKLAQIKAEQPSTTYEMFNRQIVNEEARALNMPYNIAACDSSGYSFSGGRLDHLTYYVSVNVERAEAEGQVLDRVFAAWFHEAKLAYGWAFNPAPAPKHSWGWPAMPQIDQQKTAMARKNAMAFGGTRLGIIYAEDGLDFADEVEAMATEFGITVKEMRARLLECALPKNSQPAGAEDKPDDADDDDEGDDLPPAKAGSNGSTHNRFSLRN